MSQVSQRYASALFQAADAQGKVDLCNQDLKTCCDVFENEDGFIRFLVSPEKTQREKLAALKEIFSDQLDGLTMNTLLLLLEKSRITLVPEISEDYQGICDSRNNVISMQITTAMEAEPELIEKISEKFRKQYGADSVKVECNVDPEIIGGAIIVVDGTMYDESVAGKLKALAAGINAE